MLEVAGSRAEAVEELRSLADLEDSTFAAPALVELSRIRRRQGRHGDRRTLEDELIRRFPSRAESVDLVFFRGDAAHDAGDFEGAAAAYERVVSMAPALNRAGLARMRWGQVRVHQGRFEEAAEIFEGYLEEFPDGRRWDEATYWAAYSLLQSGDTVSARLHARHIEEKDPLSYYWVLGSRLMGVAYEVDLAPEQIQDPPPTWVSTGLAGLEVLGDAGLDTARREAAGRLIRQADGNAPALLALAEGLNEVGLTWDGITVARSVLAMGYGWDSRILRAVFPFPNQDAVEQEAVERGVDPFLVAAIIRQESAFYSSAVSSAGAVGMMQVMPATGEQLARSVGPRGFTRATLFTPEINVHLGSTFLADLLNRFGPEVPYVLSAYNAGPSRLRRWRQFPEADDPLRYTERIPFEETRGYVKAVTRNAALYRWLYGTEEGAADGL
jgi:soluble lytic murein transglycosylase